jgi:hypothetical protein
MFSVMLSRAYRITRSIALDSPHNFRSIQERLPRSYHSAPPGPGLRTWGEIRESRAFVLVEAATGREIVRGAGRPVMCTADGQYMLSRTEDLRYQLWDLPAHKPLRWLVLLASVWSIAVSFLAWWSARLMTPSSPVRIDALANPT